MTETDAPRTPILQPDVPAPADPAAPVEPDARTLPHAAGAVHVTLPQRVAAYGVHAFTASGVIFAFLAAAEICAPAPRPRLVFLWLVIQVVIDALDGPMARAVHIKLRAPRIDGRTIDDIVDYLTYTFVPLLLVWRMGWLPPGLTWLAPLAMTASLFGFANTAAKDERGGFFLGFPSYWNIIAFYCGIWHYLGAAWVNAVVILALAVLTVLPVRFIYPNLAPPPWRTVTIAGLLVWLGMVMAMWPAYPRVPATWMWLSLAYPAFYAGLSAWLDVQARRAVASAPNVIAREP